MARTGRPRKPAELHVLHGTFRPDRHGKRPDSTAIVGKSDQFFEPESDDAKVFYDLVIDSDIGAAISGTDSAALCVASEIWALLNKSIEAARANPTDKSIRSAVVAYAGTFDRLVARFGLSPSDRERLKATGTFTARAS